MNAYALAEIDRVLANLLRLGTVAQLDVAEARVKVDIGGLITDCAGATRTWSAPRAGEQVLLLAPHGDLAQAVALPAIYQDAHPAPAASADIEQVTFPDGSMAAYDSAAHTLTITAGSGSVIVNCDQATINAGSGVTRNTPSTTCTGALTVQGMLTYTAGMTGSGATAISGTVAVSGGLTNNGTDVGAGHRHAGVEPGDKFSGPPV